MKIRELTASDIETPEFWHLLWLACESDEATLRRVLNQLLARSTVLGTHGSDGNAIMCCSFAGNASIFSDSSSKVTAPKTIGTPCAVHGDSLSMSCA